MTNTNKFKGKTMDITRSFSYVFEDEDWVTKLLLTAVIGIIPIVNFAVMGWIIELMRNMADGVEKPMPEWNDFGDKFMSGLNVTIASLLYNFVLVILTCCISFLIALMGGDAEEMNILVMGFLCCFSVIVIAYSIVASAVLFIGMVKYIHKPEFSVFMDFRDNMRLARENINTLLMLVVFGFVVGIVLGVITGVLSIIPCLGTIAAGLISAFLTPPIFGHLSGQAAIIISDNSGLGGGERKNKPPKNDDIDLDSDFSFA